MSSPPAESTADDSNPFSSDPSPFSSPPRQDPAELPTADQEGGDDDDAPLHATSAYPFSADPYAATQPFNDPYTAPREQDDEDSRVTSATSPPLPQTPTLGGSRSGDTMNGGTRERADSWKKTPDDVIQVSSLNDFCFLSACKERQIETVRADSPFSVRA